MQLNLDTARPYGVLKLNPKQQKSWISRRTFVFTSTISLLGVHMILSTIRDQKRRNRTSIPAWLMNQTIRAQRLSGLTMALEPNLTLVGILRNGISCTATATPTQIQMRATQTATSMILKYLVKLLEKPTLRSSASVAQHNGIL